MKKFFDMGNMVNPREARLPAKTGIGGKLKPLKTTPLANPKVALTSNKQLRAALQEFRVTDGAQIRQASKEQMALAVDKVNSYIQSNRKYKGVRFDVHEESGRSYATMTDTRTGEVVATFPGDTVLAIAGNIKAAVGLIQNKYE